jgi:hypothetical protein
MTFCTVRSNRLPRVRMELDPLFFGCGWLRSLRSRHSANGVIESEQLETGD